MRGEACSVQRRARSWRECPQNVQVRTCVHSGRRALGPYHCPNAAPLRRLRGMYKRREFHVLHGEGDDSSSSDDDSAGADAPGSCVRRWLRPPALTRVARVFQSRSRRVSQMSL